MDRITRGRAILEIDGIRAVYNRYRAENVVEEHAIGHNFENMLIESKNLTKILVILKI